MTPEAATARLSVLHEPPAADAKIYRFPTTISIPGYTRKVRHHERLLEARKIAKRRSTDHSDARAPERPEISHARAERTKLALAGTIARIESTYQQFTSQTGFVSRELSSVLFGLHATDLSLVRRRALAIRARELLESITSRPLADVLAEECVKDPWLRYTRGNLQALSMLESLHVRTGGLVVLPTEIELTALYAGRLLGIKHINEAATRQLQLRLGYFEIAILEDPCLTVAPECLILETGNGASQRFPVAYSLEIVDDKPVPTGKVTVPSAVYELNRAKGGKPGRFKSLPHGIQLRVERVDHQPPVNIHS